MSDSLVQPTFDGMAPRRKRGTSRAPRTATSMQAVPATDNPIAHVLLDVQAPHLGRLFDYAITQEQSALAVPGTLVNVQFGRRRNVQGIIWRRDDVTDVPEGSLRPLGRVMSSRPLIDSAMRRDLEAVARAYGGTVANIVRNALPPYVKKVETQLARYRADHPQPTTTSHDVAQPSTMLDEQWHTLTSTYTNGEALQACLANDQFGAFIVDCLPGPRMWARQLATIAAQAVRHGRQAVLIMPTVRHVWQMVGALDQLGLPVFAADPDTGSDNGGVVGVLGATSMSPAERFRSYLAVLEGQVRCVVGVRSAMYAPVQGPALFAILDDCAYQNADGNMPHANARGVLRLRAKLHGGTFIAAGNARSALSQWETEPDHVVSTSVSGPSLPMHPSQDAIGRQLAAVRWLNRDELARVADPTIGSRIPHTAVRILNKALEHGPVLLSIPNDAVTSSLSCASCLHLARCRRCSGALILDGNRTPRCQWCGAPAVDWKCPLCSGTRLRVIRVGAAGTVEQLRGLFRGIPMVVSSAKSANGALDYVDSSPKIVVAPFGDEPRVMLDRTTQGAYRAVAILDAWTSLYGRGLDAYTETLNRWMSVTAMCEPRARGGTVLVIGETDMVIVNALTAWNCTMLARHECVERSRTLLPPSVTAATVWGSREAVRRTLDRIGVLPDGDWGTIPVPSADPNAPDTLPSVLGPVPVPPPATQSNRDRMMSEFEDRVKAVVRVPLEHRDALAARLFRASVAHAADDGKSELRFHMDPKDLI